MSDESGPPVTTDTTRGIKGKYPKYPTTPMPTYDDDQESETGDETGEDTQVRSFYSSAFIMFVAHMWTVWTLRADINIVLAYQKEHVQQYTHMTTLLQNMKRVQWQIVPAQIQG